MVSNFVLRLIKPNCGEKKTKPRLDTVHVDIRYQPGEKITTENTTDMWKLDLFF